jgi:two-component system response regulator WspF
MRIAIVNDMKMTSELLRRIILHIPGCELAWIAYDGLEAVHKCQEDLPDLIIMDINMPVMNGVEATRLIMHNTPCAILVVTATIDGNTTEVYEALGEGALDAVNTPIMANDASAGGDSELIRKINMLKKLIKIQPRKNSMPHSGGDRSIEIDDQPIMVAIGASTGGPKAIVELLSVIPGNVNAMFTIIQHIDCQFAEGLASWLKTSCHLRVRLAHEGAYPEPGTVLIAGTNDHMIMRGDGSLAYTRKPEDNPFRPSVDVFFDSLAASWPHKGIAAVLTGIGRDGAIGMLRLKQAGWKTFAQDKDSCVVFGMPKTAIEFGGADEVLCPRDIGKRICEIINRKHMA